MSDLLNVGASALRAAYSQMRTTGHNISNVNTPGYSRQEVQLATAEGTFSGGGFVGRGVVVETVVRRYDAHLTAEVAWTGDVERRHRPRSQLERLDRVFADTENGIGAGLDDSPARWPVVNRRRIRRRAPWRPIAPTCWPSASPACAIARGHPRRSTCAWARREQGQRNPQAAGGGQRTDRQEQRQRQPSNDLLDRRDVLVEEVNKQMRPPRMSITTTRSACFGIGPGAGRWQVDRQLLAQCRYARSAQADGLA
jgi:flagellar hook-associated protein 1 FlgK